MTADLIARLTESQRTYLRLVLAHQSSKQIAQALGISAHTVDKRLKEAMRVLGVGSRIEAARLLAAVEGEQGVRELGPQSPDLAANASLRASVAHGGDDDGNDMVARGVALRDEPAAYGGMRGGPSHHIPLPFPTRDRPRNDLSFVQRAGWMIGLIIGLAIATGILLSGLTSLSTLLLALKD